MNNHVFPWWAGFWLLNPLRKLAQNPEKITGKYITPGMNILDIGCGMGYFTLPMARITGEKGKVIGVDLQSKMLSWLDRRVKTANLTQNIQSRKCAETSLLIKDLSGKIDFALAFAVVHEVPDKEKFFSEVYEALKNNGLLYMAEPYGHVSKSDFESEISLAIKAGFKIKEYPKEAKNHAVVLVK